MKLLGGKKRTMNKLSDDRFTKNREFNTFFKKII